MSRQPWGCAPIAASRAPVADIARATRFIRTFAESLIPPDLFRLLQPPFTPEAAEAARQALEELADASSFEHAAAIRNYRSGHYRSLDEAFGLVAPKRRGRGAPPKLSARIATGTWIENCLLRGESMARVADRLSDAAPHGNGIEESRVRLKYREYRKLREQCWALPMMSLALMERLIDLVGPPGDAEEAEPQINRKSKTNKSANLRSR